MIISYAVWEEGLVTAQRNPKPIAGVADLSRKDVRFTNREPGLDGGASACAVDSEPFRDFRDRGESVVDLCRIRFEPATFGL